MAQTLPDPELAVFDGDQLLQRCMGNLELAERVLAKFKERFGEDWAELERGVDAADTVQIARVAHRLKGASANIGAGGMRQRAAAIEQLGRAGRLSQIPSCMEQLLGEWTRLVDSLSSLESSAGATRS
jgi:HPt (histidine-containing phosphotransfer) domain-containing protein